MFSSPFPEFISFYCRQNSPKQDFRLLPEEQAIAESFGSQKRRAEFTMGRICAHGALSRFGLESEPILRNPETREPCWPDSVWGSITHSAGFAAVAVGLKNEIKGVGIDLENFSRPVDFKIRRHVCVDSELEWLESLPTKQANRALRIIFSAKESIFKCIYPGTKTYLTFKDAEVSVNETEKNFSFTIFKSLPGTIQQGFPHHGKYSEIDKMLLTSVYI
jgi:4'-phosphopantetheinyl transferase EntD